MPAFITSPDQALADRVEELSVMQRIDRQLNTSLNVDQAMKITLEWAMRRSHAHAGLVGVIQENHLRIMAMQGYSSELNDLENQSLPLDRLAVQDAIANGTVQRFSLTPGSDNSTDSQRCTFASHHPHPARDGDSRDSPAREPGI